jgi:hypothetical protein
VGQDENVEREGQRHLRRETHSGIPHNTLPQSLQRSKSNMFS